MEVLKVSKTSTSASVAKAISAVIANQGEVELQTVGAGACNQAIKAIVIARGYLAPMGIELVCSPSFSKVEIENLERTAIRIHVFKK
ncbi:MAG: stage V sporulation protein S [Oscillospiraceae bacterium]|nr:stage V sporulation protein S [Oscillospiraceae bacterium]